MDYASVDPTPALRWAKSLPPGLAVVVYLLIGGPVAVGVALYLTVEWADFIDFVSQPILWLVRLLRRS
jgi:hypothetical protein